VPYDSLEALEAEIERVGADRVAAVFVEPVIGAGGVRQPAPGYIEGVAELCARTGVLFVCDSVIAAFGRLGTWFGIERWDVRPDMLTFAKGVTSGYLPLGGGHRRRQGLRALLGGGRLVPPRPDVLRAPDGVRRGDGQPRTSSSARACSTAGASWRTRSPPPSAPSPTTRWWARSGTGIGALAAIAFAGEALAEAPDLPARVFAALRERGVLLRPLGDGLAFSPPLIITREQVEHVAEGRGRGVGGRRAGRAGGGRRSLARASARPPRFPAHIARVSQHIPTAYRRVVEIKHV
jgi:hypothetical protein